MSETKQAAAPVGYGYASDEVKVSPFNFGLNAGVTKLTKFEWIPNAGKDGAEQEALDIIFNINGTDKSYRMFPVTKAFVKGTTEETTDQLHPDFQDAVIDFNARVTHILHCYLSSDEVKAGLARPIANFKGFCQVAMSLLPKNYSEVVLDIFLQFQWNLGDKERTYLEIPTKMKQGRWVIAAVPPQPATPSQVGSWTKHVADNPTEDTKKALWYTDDLGNEHPFFKNGWFMTSNYSHQQTSAGAETNQAAAVSQNAGTGAAPTTW